MKRPLRKLSPAKLRELRQIVDEVNEAPQAALGRPADDNAIQSR